MAPMSEKEVIMAPEPFSCHIVYLILSKFTLYWKIYLMKSNLFSLVNISYLSRIFLYFFTGLPYYFIFSVVREREREYI